MILSSLKRFAFVSAVATVALASLPAHAGYKGLVIFGDSLSDSGNNAIVLAPNTTPNADITSNFFIPFFIYAPSKVYSNGPVWATSFASALGLSALPSMAGGTNFAFGGAQTSSAGGFPFSLQDQVNMFLGGTGGVAPSNFLYVVAGGGNNVRAALEAIDGGANVPATIGAVSQQFAADVSGIVDDLQLAGAQDIVVWNTPNLGVAPAVLGKGAQASGLATFLSMSMNDALKQSLQGEDGVSTFDLFGYIAGVYANPGAYGLTNVKDACLLGACDANGYLFWDGIHPSARGHEILAQGMVGLVVPEPQTYLLCALALAALAWQSRKRLG